MKKTIFEKLNNKKICYLVGIGISKFKLEHLDFHEKDYFVVALKKDCDLKYRYKRQIHYYNMKQHDIDYFKDNIDDFVRVQDNENGRVYELKNNSFKKYYNSL